MHRLSGPYRVYLGLVSTGYLNSEAIKATIRDGMLFCGASAALDRLPPQSRILLKSDVFVADSRFARHTYTHPEIIKAALSETLAFQPQAKVRVLNDCAEILSGSRTLKKAHGYSEAFRMRGYYELEHMFPGKVEVSSTDERPHCWYQLAKGEISKTPTKPTERITNKISAPLDYAESAFTIYCPKLKSSITSQGFAGALRLGNPHRRHPLYNDYYTCDMLEVANPNLIISDGIIAAVGGNSITEQGHELGIILISNNALAHDWIASQVFNLDPTKIDHLTMAMQRGWGPLTPNQIELGGAGLEGLKQLSQKTKFWDFGVLEVKDFASRYENEVPGSKFPLEIISQSPIEQSGAHGTFLDWLYLTHDFSSKRPLIARWPRASVCLGPVQNFPKETIVYAVGKEAASGLERLTSSKRKVLKLFGVEISQVQLKNGRRHFLLQFADQQDRCISLWDLTVLFTLGSFGKMTYSLVRPSLFLDATIFKVRSWWKKAAQPQTLRVVLTSRLPRNKWWALPSFSSSRELDRQPNL